jgi:antitoxin component of MazEF toxin-antitoxin module
MGEQLGPPHTPSLAEDAKVHAGSVVEVRLDNGRLVLDPAVVPRYELAALLAEVTRSSIHGEVPAGRRVGRETW